MNDVRDWLSQHGFSHLSNLFEENEIDGEVLFDLTEDDLRDLGLALGSRKKLLKAIAASKGAPQTPGHSAHSKAHFAERRQLTLMFVDMVGSTALSERIDPEEMSEVIFTYQNTIAGVVSRYEGMVARYMGDGVLAYFGWPRAHEDDAGRAVRAAMEVMQAIQTLTVPDGAALRARIGIATGLVVVGDVIGDGLVQEETVFGETPNLAARLQAIAEPGQVVIADATRQLLADAFELRDLGKHSLKGFRGEVPAYAVVAERTAESRLEARLSGLTGEMVGRGHELELILERWQ